MWDGSGWGWWWGGMGLMMVWAVVFWGAIIALVVWAVIRLTRRDTSGGAGEKRSPLDIAKERYARGELTKEQFEQIKKDLS